MVARREELDAMKHTKYRLSLWFKASQKAADTVC